LLGERGPLPRLTHAEEIELARQLSAGQAARKQLERGGALTPHRKRILQQTVKEGFAAREALIMRNLPLVVSVVGRFRNTELECDDLIQEGIVGLLKAAEKYDPQRGTRFGTLAVWWIRQSIGRAVSNTGRAVRLPVNRGWKVSQLRRTAARLAQETGDEPTIEAIAKAARLPAHTVAEMLRDGQAVISIEAASDDSEDRSLWERVADTTAIDPEDTVIEHSLTQAVEASLERLDSREAEILRLRFGIGGGEARPLRSIASEWRMSPEGVRQIGERAMQHLTEMPGVQELEMYLSE
jgi:RNA polymerase primary sigma factor